MWSKYGHPEDDYVAALYEYPETGKYVISFHHNHGEMPAFDGKDFETLAAAKTWAKSELGITHWRDASGQFTAEPVM